MFSTSSKATIITTGAGICNEDDSWKQDTWGYIHLVRNLCSSESWIGLTHPYPESLQASSSCLVVSWLTTYRRVASEQAVNIE